MTRRWTGALPRPGKLSKHKAKAVEAAAEEPQTVYFGGKVHFFLELGCQVSTDFMSMKRNSCARRLVIDRSEDRVLFACFLISI